MKKLIKFNVIFFTLSLFILTSCSNPSSSNGSGDNLIKNGAPSKNNISAIFLTSPSEYMIFYNDGSLILWDTTTINNTMKGTYKGNPNADGKLSLKPTDVYYNGIWYDFFEATYNDIETYYLISGNTMQNLGQLTKFANTAPYYSVLTSFETNPPTCTLTSHANTSEKANGVYDSSINRWKFTFTNVCPITLECYDPSNITITRIPVSSLPW